MVKPAGQIWNQYQMQLQSTGDFMKGTPLELNTSSVQQYRDSKRLNKVNCPFLNIQRPKFDEQIHWQTSLELPSRIEHTLVHLGINTHM